MRRIIEINKNLNDRYENLKEIGKFNMVLFPFGVLSLVSLLFKFAWFIPIVAMIVVISRGVYQYGLKEDNNEE